MELLPVCSPMARNNCSTSCPDSADVGSSMIRMRASNERAFAMVTSCRFTGTKPFDETIRTQDDAGPRQQAPCLAEHPAAIQRAESGHRLPA